jgi:hypothetical protein
VTQSRLPAALRTHGSSLLLGVASAVLYATVSLAPAFLLPLQAAGAGRGFKAMALASATAAACISGFQLALFAGAELLSAGIVLMGLAAPLALIAALLLMAAPRFARVPFALRSLGGGLLVALIAYPAFAWALSQPGVREMLDEAVVMAASSLGLEAADSAALFDGMKGVLSASFGAVLFLFLFGSAWGGARLGRRWRFIRAAKAAFASLPKDGQLPDPELTSARAAEFSELGSDEPALPPALGEYRVPQALVWLLLASWAGILASRYIPSPAVVSVAWNVALSVSICYGVQGLAVAGALLGRIGMAPAGRMLAAVFIVLVLLGGTVGLVAAAAMAALGTLETWIPLRAVKTQGE